MKAKKLVSLLLTAAVTAGALTGCGGDGAAQLYEAGALIPIDEYWDACPNIRDYLKEEDWDRHRQEDGHIYWIPQFNVVHREGVEEYFSLIEAYMKENPCMTDGEKNIPFMLLCDDWRYFCLENPPQFLAGYPNDGYCMVDPDTLTVMDYNVTETAKAYFALLNGEYHRGMIDPESFTQSYEEYLEKLASGRCSVWWSSGGRRDQRLFGRNSAGGVL